MKFWGDMFDTMVINSVTVSLVKPISQCPVLSYKAMIVTIDHLISVLFLVSVGERTVGFCPNQKFSVWN